MIFLCNRAVSTNLAYDDEPWMTMDDGLVVGGV